MDVVFNHTAEGNEKGPIISFRGVDNSVYYMVAPKVLLNILIIFQLFGWKFWSLGGTQIIKKKVGIIYDFIQSRFILFLLLSIIDFSLSNVRVYGYIYWFRNNRVIHSANLASYLSRHMIFRCQFFVMLACIALILI